ncbi:glycosyltransferase family 2 protein [Nonomuraea salmonea]|uniref:glycosyltransferase family 2 protein n=1 Tax=Nonomuraea salmonea TaxID=46181 RepID=UPI0031F12B8B
MLVSIGIPVRNGADRLETAVRSALAQDHADIEVVISDNASTDGTEELCRELARQDERISYHRQPRDLHVVGNFVEVLRRARGAYFRWMGDDDLLEPSYVSKALRPFLADERLILVTTDMTYTRADGSVHRPRYRGTRMLSDDPVDRLDELWDVVTTQHHGLDPLYGLMRRERVAAVPRPLMIREDEVYATMLALTAPWGGTCPSRWPTAACASGGCRGSPPRSACRPGPRASPPPCSSGRCTGPWASSSCPRSSAAGRGPCWPARTGGGSGRC